MNTLGAGIPAPVVREHLNHLATLMQTEDVAATLIFHPSNMLAFLGTTHSAWDRLVCGLVTRDGQAHAICPAFEQPGFQAETDLPTFHTWQEHEDSYACVAAALASAGIKSGRLAVDGRIWLETLTALRAALPDFEVTSGEHLLREVRICKTDAEKELLRNAHARGEHLFLALTEMLEPDMTELEVQQALAARMAVDDLKASPMVQTGPNGAIPHHRSDDSLLKPGHTLVVDSVTLTAGYHNDVTRTFAVGEPSKKAKEAYQVVRAAQAEAIAAARAGLACEKLDAVARDVITQAGFGAYFTHRLGHGMGIECHEPPYLVGGNQTTLRAGMCLTIEPGIYVPGEFGIRIEDDILITPDGCEVIKGELPTDVTPAFDT